MTVAPLFVFFNVLVIANYYFVRKVLIQWRLSLRREMLLEETCHSLTVVIFEEGSTKEDAADVLLVGSVRIVDEIHNQMRHKRDLWPRAPQIGKEWSDFEPAPLSFDDGD